MNTTSATTVLLLLDIRSAHNVGSLFRTADGLGATIGLIGITPRPSGHESEDRLPHIVQKAHAAISKTALGAETIVPWEYFPTFEEAVSYYRLLGYHLAAIEQATTSSTITAIPTEKPVALILGPEVTGIPVDILGLVDAIYEIPMVGEKESYNVSVAGALALYQTQQNRRII